VHPVLSPKEIKMNWVLFFKIIILTMLDTLAMW